MLVAPRAILDAIRRGRCVKSMRPLALDEILLSRDAVPSLYARTQHKGDQVYVLGLLEPLKAILQQDDTAVAEREVIRQFMERVIGHGRIGREAYVHSFVFEFWSSLWDNESDSIPLAEKYMWGDARGAKTEFSENVLPLIRDDRSYPDIVARGGHAGRDILVIDVKLDDLDDRAVGQVIRYYGLARRTIDNHRHGCDLRRVIPIVIVGESTQTKYWEAVPAHFREFLVVCFYRLEQGRVVLHDARKELLSWTRQARVSAR
jgi:hypothetical protein